MDTKTLALKQALAAMRVARRFVWHYADSHATTRIAERFDAAISHAESALATSGENMELPKFDPRKHARKPLDEPGQGDDIPCVKCGAAALDTGLECSECGFDNYEAVTGKPFNGAAEAALAVPVAEPVAGTVAEPDETHQYALTLATGLHAKHYPEVTQWRPLPDTLGLLTQIDNMVCGLVKPKPTTPS